MKKMILMLTLLAVSASTAMANSYGNAVPFANISAASAAVKTSSAFSVRGFSTKSMNVSGVTLTSSPSSITFKNMSGTVIAQCAPTSSGPWSTCVANDYAQTAVSRTTNGLFTWSDAVAYIRLQWTSGTVGGKLKVWLDWIE